MQISHNRLLGFVNFITGNQLAAPLYGKSQMVTPTSYGSAIYLEKLSGAKNHSVLSTRWANVYLVMKLQPTISNQKICQFVSSTAALRASPGPPHLQGGDAPLQVRWPSHLPLYTPAL